VRCGDVEQGADHARRVVTELPEHQRVAMVLDVAQRVANAVPAKDHQRPQVTALHEVLAASPLTGVPLGLPS
jgi:hypothetical protein